ncbi:ATP-binding protein [Kitasatospora sp. GP82]|uniref:ATP-binding protein n=1 Tax=Kitasatospora sp. GP82 TaxID=3035089 RepID=UPI002475326C|nr:ATP-binding protein [Kitasatospora sp. GP82]MDH6128834.1 anti-sigma regulatory factor (Ser/Thr protein kinase) [Kitasatospora sp. GP82]
MTTTTSSTRWFLVCAPASVGTARRHAVTQLRSWGYRFDEDVAMTFALLVSELVTNACLHGRGDFLTVALVARGEEVFVEVLDASNVAPRQLRAGAGDEGGRGMFLVDALSRSWGTQSTPRGKAVWFTYTLPPQPAPSRRARRAGLLHALTRRPRPRIRVGARPALSAQT